jgi:hypothetical protein
MRWQGQPLRPFRALCLLRLVGALSSSRSWSFTGLENVLWRNKTNNSWSCTLSVLKKLQAAPRAALHACPCSRAVFPPSPPLRSLRLCMCFCLSLPSSSRISHKKRCQLHLASPRWAHRESTCQSSLQGRCSPLWSLSSAGASSDMPIADSKVGGMTLPVRQTCSNQLHIHPGT